MVRTDIQMSNKRYRHENTSGIRRLCCFIIYTYDNTLNGSYYLSLTDVVMLSTCGADQQHKMCGASTLMVQRTKHFAIYSKYEYKLLLRKGHSIKSKRAWFYQQAYSQRKLHSYLQARFLDVPLRLSRKKVGIMHIGF